MVKQKKARNLKTASVVAPAKSKPSIKPKTVKSAAKNKVKKTTPAPVKTPVVQKKTPKKVAAPKKEEKKEEENENEKGSGEYIHFKSPKYLNYARKLSKLSHDECLKQVEKYKLNLQEKIHTGNMLSNMASKVVQYGEYTKSKKAFYKDLQKYHDLYDDCMQKTRKALQDICILNEVPKSATKDILAERVADGMLLGRIPKCPECHGGRLRFNNQNGTYFCPGYIDGGYFYTDLGDDYIFCNRTFKFGEIKRGEFLLSKPSN